MGRDITVYTDLDSIFDTERGIIQKKISGGFSHLPLAERIAKSDKYFNRYMLKKYKERKYRLFNQPELGITPEWFEEAYKNRSIDDWDYFYPTPLLTGMLKVILGIESNARGGCDINNIDLVVNVAPYVEDDWDKEDKDFFINSLTETLELKLNGRTTKSETPEEIVGKVADLPIARKFRKITIINEDVNNVTSNYYSKFTYVFKRDIMFGYKEFHESLPEQPIQKVTFVIPELAYKLNNNIEINVEETFNFFLTTMSMYIKLVPIGKDLYECYL